MNLTRWIFSLSLAAGIFWLLGFIVEPVIRREPSSAILLVSSMLTASALSLLLYKLRPDFLKAFSGTAISTKKYYFFSMIASYFLLVPVSAVVSYLLIRIFGRIDHNESLIFIGLFSLWFPLWWFVPVGLSTGWLLYKRRAVSIGQRQGPAV